ncbi:MAG: transcriptional regulator [Chloroflexi bacterium RBG_19FT_COMBO_47_9]|nr:MAG: transcriptional regulator [Chloroflexi bacterium RBG_19FT_COMBO_47_9]
MIESIKLVTPQIIPPLDDEFRPAALASRTFQKECSEISVPLVIGLERGDGKLSRFEAQVFPVDHPRAQENFYFAERLLKYLLWQRGGSKIYIGGPCSIGNHLQAWYSPNGKRSFDYHFMSEQVYERPFLVELCDPSEVPPANDTGRALGRHLDGCRIGFDLGASDRKVSAVMDGRVVYSEEVIWEPRNHSDPEYHYNEIVKAIKSAASKMPRVDAIGGSSAGIYLDNRPMVASLFRSIPAERFHEIQNIFLRIRDEMDVPLEVLNDGDVTALAGSMSIEENGVLGIAMGSSLAAGYIDMHGHILGWLNELAFAPIDYSSTAPMDEWSGDIGCGAQYLSQQCIFRLAPRVGIQIPSNLPDAEKLLFIQEKLNTGHKGAIKIWQSLGIYLGYALAHYATFYEMKHVIILGRCTSGLGGTLILEEACKVLEAEFPEIASRLQVQLPDEHSRRIGQSIAAASLPIIDELMEQEI